jgi:DNA-binding CsgD family transcriptional regulator
MMTGLDALTASERRVTEMAAGGLTNREIAQALFVTEKTIEWHLGQAYRKLEDRLALGAAPRPARECLAPVAALAQHELRWP